jgi:hypothetical protein
VIAEVAPGAEGRVADGTHVVTDPTAQISNKLGLNQSFRLIFAEFLFTFLIEKLRKNNEHLPANIQGTFAKRRLIKYIINDLQKGKNRNQNLKNRNLEKNQ